MNWTNVNQSPCPQIALEYPYSNKLIPKIKGYCLQALFVCVSVTLPHHSYPVNINQADNQVLRERKEPYSANNAISKFSYWLSTAQNKTKRSIGLSQKESIASVC